MGLLSEPEAGGRYENASLLIIKKKIAGNDGREHSPMTVFVHGQAYLKPIPLQINQRRIFHE